MSDRTTPAIVAAAAVAAVGALGALALGERPFLGLDRISPWVVFWAVGLFALLMLVPLAVHRRLSDSEVERDRRWELAVLAWGGIALAAGLAFFAIAAFAGFDRDEAVGALAIVGVAESVLVVGGILLLMLTTG